MKRLLLGLSLSLLLTSSLMAKSATLRQFWAATQTLQRDVEYGNRYFAQELLKRSIQIEVRSSDEPILHEDFISLSRLIYQQEEHFFLYRSYRLAEPDRPRPSKLQIAIDGEIFTLNIEEGRVGCEAHACYYGIWLWLPKPIVEALAQAKTSLSLGLLETSSLEAAVRFNASAHEVTMIAQEVAHILSDKPLPAKSHPTIILERQS